MTVAQLDRAHDFTGQTVAITGGAGVLGGEMACALAWLGANVVILDRNVTHAPALLDRMGPHASRAEVIETDVLDPASLAGALDRSSSASAKSTRSSTAPAATTPRPPRARMPRSSISRPRPSGGSST